MRRVRNCAFRVKWLGLGLRVSGLRSSGLGFEFSDLGLRIYSLLFIVYPAGFWFEGVLGVLGFRI
jgi:hypothetical protein